MVKSGTLILHTAARILMPLQLLFSVFLLLRGHDEPGGGFIAGLVAAGAFTLYLFAFGVSATREVLRMVDPRDLIGIGLLLGMISVFPAWFMDQPFLTAQWWEIPGIDFKASTPLIFDVGVYLAVLGSVLAMVMTLMEVDKDEP
ncbi:Na+/H+ antiporter subunit B [Billgrantia montanilacus]|jgi:multicomponent Na+:H+ antiporter subunit B|uniref:Na+/H+ antiporter subunit B n=1 Tax=Billgrantia montanilacus TaxID=2282305 RepID=A0A368TSF8_9GAMM|nr:Na+/H+ antiporter subunit B [Halomonas montanilacus]RCV87655.1 Na+/H+ antiporter subunit B [Halomonas montanilacus]